MTRAKWMSFDLLLLWCLIDEKDEVAVSLIIGESGHDTRKVDELSLLLV
jgi:hypothetical protein